MTPSPNRETEREIASWVRKHNNNIVQQVEKLTLMPTCAAVKVEGKSCFVCCYFLSYHYFRQIHEQTVRQQQSRGDLQLCHVHCH